MSKYTTGEMAKLCDISVRTVQFYDNKNLLKPSELSEGGRRLYSDEDLKKLRLICMLKTLGLTLDSIKGILEDETSDKVLLLLLDEQKKQIEKEMQDNKFKIQAIEIVRDNIVSDSPIPVKSVSDIEMIMKNKKELKKVHLLLLAAGIVMDIIEISLLALWIVKGIWQPFALGMPIVIIMGLVTVRMYHQNTAYICPECGETFRPSFWKLMSSKHTPKTRKLKCPSCGNEGYCVETYYEGQPV